MIRDVRRATAWELRAPNGDANGDGDFAEPAASCAAVRERAVARRSTSAVGPAFGGGVHRPALPALRGRHQRRQIRAGAGGVGRAAAPAVRRQSAPSHRDASLCAPSRPLLPRGCRRSGSRARRRPTRALVPDLRCAVAPSRHAVRVTRRRRRRRTAGICCVSRGVGGGGGLVRDRRRRRRLASPGVGGGTGGIAVGGARARVGAGGGGWSSRAAAPSPRPARLSWR